jgi:hypothetical protein
MKNTGTSVGTGLNYPTSGPFSVSFWAKIPTISPEGVTGINNYVISDAGILPAISPSFGSSATRYPLLYMGSSNFKYFVGRFDDDEWHHFVFVVQGYGQNDIDDSELYVDGTQLATYFTTKTGAVDPINNPIAIGYRCKCAIDELRIYDKALTLAEVRSLYENPAGSAVGMITADRINVGTLSAISADMGSLTAGTITLDSAGYIKGGATGYDSGTGFWLGYDSTAYKLFIGDSSGDKLTWDGSDLIITGRIEGSTFVGTGGTIFIRDSNSTYLSDGIFTTQLNCTTNNVLLYTSINMYNQIRVRLSTIGTGFVTVSGLITKDE